jgi:hypothetical protein
MLTVINNIYYINVGLNTILLSFSSEGGGVHDGDPSEAADPRGVLERSPGEGGEGGVGPIQRPSCASRRGHQSAVGGTGRGATHTDSHTQTLCVLYV